MRCSGNGAEATLFQVVVQQPRRGHAHAHAHHRGVAQRIKAVGAQARPDRHLPRLARDRVRQRHFGAVVGAQRHPGQAHEFVGVFGHGLAAQHAGRGHHDARHVHQLDRHHRGVAHFAHAQCAVDAFADQVTFVVAQQPVDIDAGIALQELGERPHEMLLPQRVGRKHPQVALRLLTHAAQLGFKRVPALQQGLGALEAALAVFGQAHAARGALEQAHAEGTFERLQPPAHRGLRGAHLRRRTREAAGFDDANEGLHEVQAVARGAFIHAPIVYLKCRFSVYRVWFRCDRLAVN